MIATEATGARNTQPPGIGTNATPGASAIHAPPATELHVYMMAPLVAPKGPSASLPTVEPSPRPTRGRYRLRGRRGRRLGRTAKRV